MTAVLMAGLLGPVGTVSVTNAKENEWYGLGKSVSREETIENPMESTQISPETGYQEFTTGEYRKQDTGTSQNCGTNASWSLTDGVLTIAGSGAMTDYTGNDNAPWHDQAASITSIVISDGITTIGEAAFYECSKAVTVSIPATVSSIGKYAFAECHSVTEVMLPNSVTELPYAAFANCTSMTSIQCDGVTTIGDYVFQRVPFEQFTVPAGVTSLSDKAFFNAPVKEFAVAAGNTVYIVEDGILYTEQGQTLFAYPIGKTDTSFVVPSHVTTIGKLAMSYTSNLTSVSIGSSVTTLEESAFQETGLVSVSIPDSVTTVGMFTFYGCPELTSITFGNGLEETSYQMFRECSKLTEIHFSAGLKILGAHTFAYCTSLTSVTLPATIGTLGVGCFGECYQLTDFSSAAIGNVPYSAFWNCYKLKNVTLNEGVTAIYRCAFYNCNNLTAITLPQSVTYVHSFAFPKNTVITCMNANMQPFGQNGYRYLQQVSITGERDYTKAYEVLALVNAQRTQNGLGVLHMNASLMESAMVRASENAVCFSHTRPDGSSCFDLDADMCAENIAVGDQTAQQVMNSWMNSQGHRQNILLEDATTIGIGCFVHNGVLYWTQCFGTGSDTVDCSSPANTTVTQKIALATEKFDEASTGTGVNFSFGESVAYEYKFQLQLEKNSIKAGENTMAKLCVVNPGFSSTRAVLNPEGVTFSSSDQKVAKVDSAGTVNGVAKGSATITGAMTYYNASGTLTVSAVTASQQETLTSKEIAKVKKQLPKGKVQSVKKIKKTSLRVTCKKMKQVSGYQVRLSKNKKMTKAKVLTTKKRQVTFKKLKKNQKYYIQVRVYKKVSGKKVYGKWGTVKKVKL